MKDDKRLLRRLKRDLKQSGNRKRRRYLKDTDADPSDFTFGRKRSDVMNEPRPQRDDAPSDRAPGDDAPDENDAL